MPRLPGRRSGSTGSPILPRPAAPRRGIRRAGRSLAIGTEVHGVLPEAPRRPQRRDLLFLARSIVRDSVRAEFVREGLDVIDLAEDFGRADLQAAALLTDRDYLAFVDRTVAVIDVRGQAPDALEAGRIVRAAASRDAHGLTLEAATGLAAYLIDAAVRLEGLDDATATGPAAEDLREAFIAEQAEIVREAARETLGSLVTAPQELRSAIAIRRAAEQSSRDGDAGPSGTGASAGHLGSASASGGSTTGSTGAAGSAQQSAPGGASSAWRQSAPRPGSGERMRPSDLRRLMETAQTARAFFESDTGRAAFDLMKKGSEVLSERAARRGGGTGGSAPSS